MADIPRLCVAAVVVTVRPNLNSNLNLWWWRLPWRQGPKEVRSVTDQSVGQEVRWAEFDIFLLASHLRSCNTRVTVNCRVAYVFHIILKPSVGRQNPWVPVGRTVGKPMGNRTHGFGYPFPTGICGCGSHTRQFVGRSMGTHGFIRYSILGSIFTFESQSCFR